MIMNRSLPSADSMKRMGTSKNATQARIWINTAYDFERIPGISSMRLYFRRNYSFPSNQFKKIDRPCDFNDMNVFFTDEENMFHG
jgi:hypothetical protein